MRPNTVSNIRHAVALPLLVLIGALPIEIMFVQALIEGRQTAALFLGIFVVPLWVMAPIGIMGFYRDRRRLMDGEFSERHRQDAADESR